MVDKETETVERGTADKGNHYNFQYSFVFAIILRWHFCFLFVISGARTHMDSELTTTWGISEEREPRERSRSIPHVF